MKRYAVIDNRERAGIGTLELICYIGGLSKILSYTASIGNILFLNIFIIVSIRYAASDADNAFDISRGDVFDISIKMSYIEIIIFIYRFVLI